MAAFVCAMLLLTPPSGYYHLSLALFGIALLRADRSLMMGIPRGEQTAGGRERGARGHLSKFNLLLILVLLLTAIPVEYGLTDAGPAREEALRRRSFRLGDAALDPADLRAGAPLRDVPVPGPKSNDPESGVCSDQRMIEAGPSHTGDS